MMISTRRAWLVLAAFALGMFTASSVVAQNEGARKDFEIKALKQQTRKAPNFSGTGESLGGNSSWANKPWHQIEVDFSSTPEWADDVQIKYYVLIGQGKELQMFTGQITHINVDRATHHYSAMFLHPSTLVRYGQGKVEAVAVQLFYKGRLVDQTSDPKANRRWWEQYTPVEGFLLAPEQTPWSVVAFQRYEASKPAGSR
jgi:hypothetical protein